MEATGRCSDVLIKQKLGFDEAYWHRAAKVLRIGDRLRQSPAAVG
jgi:hypothetical protein